ncbi:O-antigen ligase family protein [Patulibacter defluvii]|uniref:O-antigen ligase family protein n=1 Tax=Patulibacter defluvii TaxID=3095358 RepID=UPI002A7666A6|nr:O-antigen ligase family protein [Patulibacter sp. DM4]
MALPSSVHRRRRRPVARIVDALPAPDPVHVAPLLLVVLALLLALRDGGFAGAHAYPMAVVAVALLAWPSGSAAPLPRSARVALAATVALAAWSALSIAWATVPARALEATARTVLYGVGLALVLRVPWPVAAARSLLALVGGGIALLAVATLLRTALAGDPGALVVDGRLTAPLGYVNATANLWLLGIWPLVDRACHGPRRGRPAAAAAVVVLVGATLLTQSRGALLTLALTAVAYLLLVRPRAAPLALIAGVTLLALPLAMVAFDVRSASSIPDLRSRLDAAVLAIAAAALVAATVVAGGQRARGRLPRALRRRLAHPRLRTAAAATIAVVLASAALVAIGDPVAWGGDRWRSFRDGGYREMPATGSRLGSLGSSRYDFYRVALDRFAARPLTGDGAENIAVAYLRDRHGDEAPVYAHSLPLGVLAGLGAVGLALWAALLGGLGRAVAVARRRAGPEGRAVVAAAVAGFLAWFVHGLGDWLWEFPALTLLAFALLAVAARTVADGPPLPPGPRLRWPAIGRRLTAVLVAAVLLLPLALASHWERRATALAFRQPERAIALFGRAAALDPLDADPLTSRAVLRRRRGDADGWERDLRRALGRVPDDWFARAELAMALAQRGDRRGARREAARAIALNPRQPVLGELRDGRPVAPDAIERRLAAAQEQRLRPLAP